MGERIEQATQADSEAISRRLLEIIVYEKACWIGCTLTLDNLAETESAIGRCRTSEPPVPMLRHKGGSSLRWVAAQSLFAPLVSTNAAMPRRGELPPTDTETPEAASGGARVPAHHRRHLEG